MNPDEGLRQNFVAEPIECCDERGRGALPKESESAAEHLEYGKCYTCPSVEVISAHIDQMCRPKAFKPRVIEKWYDRVPATSN